MKKIVCMGSCLSASILEKLLSLSSDYTVIGSHMHLRTDLADKLLNGKYSAPGATAAQELIKKYASGDVGKNLRRVESQTNDALQGLVEQIKEADIFLFDNNYDLQSKLYEFDARYSFSNLAKVSESAGVKVSDYFPIGNASAIYQGFVNSLHSLNPGLLVFFIQYPIGDFETAGPYRAKKSLELADTLALTQCTVIPLVSIPKELRTSKGPFYFEPEVYEAYAHMLMHGISGSLPDAFSVRHLTFGSLCELTGKPVQKVGQNTVTADNPYRNRPAHHFWRTGVADCYPLALQNLYKKKFPISKDDRIGTCGSCFAQHVGRRLKARGYNLLDVEPAPTDLPRAEYTSRGYGIYSARYGNIYTPRQLVQLFDEAFAGKPIDEVWESNGRYFDPFRPNIDPDGFETREAVLAERRKHLAAVRRLFQSTDLLIFTMGLTESWVNSHTGIVYPTCPGVTVGTFDPLTHRFHNLNYTEIADDMNLFIRKMKGLNSRFRLLLTVSPVPLTATAENRHVLVSTTYSKSVLRAIAGDLADRNPDVDYFPSYELVTAPSSRGMLYSSNMRNVHDEGVDLVMTHFFSEHRLGPAEEGGAEPEENDELCDEAFIELAKKPVDRI